MCGQWARTILAGLVWGVVLLAGCGGGPAGAPPPPTAAATATAGVPAEAGGAVQAVVAEAARRAGVAPGSVQVGPVQAVEWPDAALGCPQPGRVYAQVITPGWRIPVTVNGQTATYHANRTGSTVVTCDRAP